MLDAHSPSASTTELHTSSGSRDHQSDVEALVEQLQRMPRPRSIGAAANLGRAILAAFFQGDHRAFRARGTRDRRLRALIHHPKNPLSQPVLWRCLGICEMTDESPWLLESTLGVTHARAVLGLPLEAREQLLREAEAKGWDAEALATRAAVERASKNRRSRSHGTLLARAVRLAERAAADASGAVSTAVVTHTGRAEAEKARDRLVRAEQELKALRAALDERLSEVA